MNQEPKDRLWAVIVVLSIIIFAMGVFLIETRIFLTEGRALSYERGATDCLDLIVDDDRDFFLPVMCSRSEVIVHYPPEICENYFPDHSTCGSKWVTLS